MLFMKFENTTHCYIGNARGRGFGIHSYDNQFIYQIDGPRTFALRKSGARHVMPEMTRLALSSALGKGFRVMTNVEVATFDSGLFNSNLHKKTS
jgi:hypothetical protein